MNEWTKAYLKVFQSPGGCELQHDNGWNKVMFYVFQSPDGCELQLFALFPWYFADKFQSPDGCELQRQWTEYTSKLGCFNPLTGVSCNKNFIF